MRILDFFRRERIRNESTNEANNNESVDVNDKRFLEWLGLSENVINYSGIEALKEATIYACIRILSENISKLPLKIYQEQDGIRKATDHYLYNILKLRPNAYMSASDFWKAVETQRDIHGNAYVWIDIPARGKSKGKVRGLYPLDSSKVKIYIDDVGLLGAANHVYYIYTDKQGKQFKIKSDNILHFKNITFNGVSGISPIEYLEKTVNTAGQSTEYLNNSFKNGLQVKGLIHYIGDLSHSAKELFRKEFESMASGLKNANRVSLLPFGYQYTPISNTMADAQFLENKQLTIRQIAAAFGIKMHQLNDLERSTYSNITEQERDFYISTLLPILTMYEQELTYKLFLNSEIEQGYYVKFNADAVLRADIKTRYEAYRTAIQAGFLTPNEVRELDEREAKDGGDALLINGNMVPISEAGAAYRKGGDK